MKFKVKDQVVVIRKADVFFSRQGCIEVADSADQEGLPYKVRFPDNDFDWYEEADIELVGNVKTAYKPSEVLEATRVSTEGKQAVVEAPVASEGVKFDSYKLQWWYLWQFLPELEQVAYVLQYGDKKYPAEDGSNWKRLDNLERRASSAAMRHLSAYLQDDKLDNETTKSHLAHCITNLLFLMYNDRNQTKGETK